MSSKREPSGIPSGGQFAATAHPESDVQLDPGGDVALSDGKSWRSAVIQIPKGDTREDSVRRIARYLPSCYQVVCSDDETVTISGTDNAGWTLDGYVLPRLASGLIIGKETDPVPVPTVWISDNGFMACKAHGGYAMAGEAKAHPDDEMLFTERGTWLRVGSEAAAMLREKDYPAGPLCEVCRSDHNDTN